jgi:hypothetical protein
VSVPLESLNQWCADLYASWGIAHQGCVAPDLLVLPEELAASEDQVIVEAVNGYVEDALERARLLHGEFSPVALASYGIDAYAGSLTRVGHESLLLNGWVDSISLKAAIAGFCAIGCSGYAELATDFGAFLNEYGDRLGRHLAALASNEEGDSYCIEQFEAFDGRAGDYDLNERHAQWLRTHARAGDGAAALNRCNALFESRALSASWKDGTPMPAQLSAMEGVTRTLSARAKTKLGDPLWIGNRRLNEFVPGGDPIPVMAWHVPPRNDPGIAKGAEYHSIVITRPRPDAPAEALLTFRDFPAVLARMSLHPVQYRQITAIDA